MESYGLVNERKQGRHEKAFFYGPFAHPFLKMASRIDQMYEDDRGVDWSWIPEEEDKSVEPEFVDYKNWDPERSRETESVNDDGREYFEAYNGVGYDEMIEEFENVDSLEDLNGGLSGTGMEVREVSAVNLDNVGLKEGYIWDGYSDHDIDEGDYLLFESKGSENTGFEEVEALGRIDGENEKTGF